MIKKILLEEWENLSRLILVIIRRRIISNFFKEENLNFLLVTRLEYPFSLFLYIFPFLFYNNNIFSIFYFKSIQLHGVKFGYFGTIVS